MRKVRPLRRFRLDQPSLKGPLEDGLPQTVGGGEVGFNGGVESLDDGQAALDSVDDGLLLDGRWNRNDDGLNFPKV